MSPAGAPSGRRSPARERWRLSATLRRDLRRAECPLNPLNRANAGPAQPGRLEDAGSADQLGSDRVDLGLGERRLTDRLAAFGAVLASPLHPRLDPLLNDRALELGETPSIWKRARPAGVVVS